jgi:hypothetical protein
MSPGFKHSTAKTKHKEDLKVKKKVNDKGKLILLERSVCMSFQHFWGIHEDVEHWISRH